MTVHESSRWRSLSEALGIVIVIVAVEYFFRHYVLLWFPQIGSLRVNDMLSLLVAYFILAGGLGLLVHVEWGKEWPEIGREIHALLMTWRYVGWVAIVVLSFWVLPIVDRLLWGTIKVPISISSYQGSGKNPSDVIDLAA